MVQYMKPLCTLFRSLLFPLIIQTNKCKEPRDYTPVASITQNYLYNDHHIYDTQPSGLFCTLDKMAAHLHTLQ